MGGKNNGPNSFNITDPRYYSMLTDPTDGMVNETQDYKNVMSAIEFLRERKDADDDTPFFIFLPLLNPHPPYSVPEPFYSAIDPDSLPPLKRVSANSSKPDYYELIREYRNLTSLDDEFWRKLNSVYLGSISFSDHMFGMLMDAVDELGHRDDTTVTVFSDHGDYAGDYGLVEKWPSGLEDVLTRVPLIIRSPEGQPNIVEEQVQLFDIVPTMLELANINASHVHFGSSLAPQVLLGVGGDPLRRVYAEGGYSTREPRDFEGDDSSGGMPEDGTDYYPKNLQQQEVPLSVCRAVMIRTLEYKLIYRSDWSDTDHDSELYDLRADPNELTNVYNVDEYRSIRDQLKMELLEWYMLTSDVTPWVEDDRNGECFPFPPDDESLNEQCGVK